MYHARATINYVVFIVGIIVTRTNGYIIHESCNDPEDRSLIIQNLNKAFHMAEIAKISLEQRPWNAQAQPVFAEISQLADWIFKNPGNTQLVREGEGVQLPLDHVWETLNGVLRLRNEVTFDGNEKNELQTIFRCVNPELQPTKAGRFFDGAQQILLSLVGEESGQKDKNDPCNTKRNQAWTTVGENEPSVVQLCPSYLEKIKRVKYHDVGNFDEIKLDASTSKMWPKPQTAMDLAAFMDMTLLHEMTHTTAGINREDERPAYGWTNVINKPIGKAFRNADSIAVFALAHQMLLETTMKPQQDGSIIVKSITS
ncbi:hypothetical protein BGZ60DRAFT_525782 [Tricladium varicosporioides]|nr:hypothetical protein BGZ60DRAFT_525782 [Hymenoscyphus varicosporioides]